MIVTENCPEGLRVTIPRDEVLPERLNRWLEWLRLEAAAHRSRMTEAEADHLADELKTEWWAANKSRFIPPSQP